MTKTLVEVDFDDLGDLDGFHDLDQNDEDDEDDEGDNDEQDEQDDNDDNDDDNDAAAADDHSDSSPFTTEHVSNFTKQNRLNFYQQWLNSTQFTCCEPLLPATWKLPQFSRGL